jgi:hypothetical protein
LTVLTVFRRRSDPRYGWTIVATLAVTETISWGVLYYAFAVFIPSMQQDLGWSKTELTGAFSIALATSALEPSRSGVGWIATVRGR